MAKVVRCPQPRCTWPRPQLTLYVQTISPEAAVIPGDELIELTKQVVEAGFGAGNGDNLSDDMIFRGPGVAHLKHFSLSRP